MTRQPLNSVDHGKILIFMILFVPTVFFGLGVIPAIALSFGFYMMKRNKDFSSIETSVVIFKGYIFVLFIFGQILSVFKNIDWSYELYVKNDFFIFLFFSSLIFLYIPFVHYLFYSPLKNHREWVVDFGVFTNGSDALNQSKIKLDAGPNENPDSVVYSAADEISKLLKLKEDGHITDEEYNQCKVRILMKV